MSLALRVTHTAPLCNEHELVAAVRRGDDRAFEELYARYRSRIGAYIFGMVGDHGRAEDIAQEVFISALRRLRQTDRSIIFKPWIYEIAKNACIDEFRRTRRMHEVPLETDDEREISAVALSSPTPTPDVAVESKQRLTDLRGAFRGLSESHHRILVLRELEGLSYNQIGDRMGMSKPVVESTLFRARRRLGEEFEEIESGRRCARVQSLIAASAERPLHTLGLRERRQFARHVAHCELCQRQARQAGVDESLYKAPNLIGRIAVLAPIPWLRIRQGPDEAIHITGSHHAGLLHTLRSVVPYLDPSRPGIGVGRAIATAAIVVAGAGASGGLVSDMTGHAARPPRAVLAAPLPPVGAQAASSGSTPAIHPGARYGVARLAHSSAAAVASAGPLANPGAIARTTEPGIPLPLEVSAASPTRRSSPESGPSSTLGGGSGAPSRSGPVSPVDLGSAPAAGAGTQVGAPPGGTSGPAGNPASPSGGPGLDLPPASGTIGAVQGGLGTLPLKSGSLPPPTGISLPSLPNLPLPAVGSSPTTSNLAPTSPSVAQSAAPASDPAATGPSVSGALAGSAPATATAPATGTATAAVPAGVGPA
jgi:RNA polymerase sigma factor (sigma-70 family)